MTAPFRENSADPAVLRSDITALCMKTIVEFTFTDALSLRRLPSAYLVMPEPPSEQIFRFVKKQPCFAS
jgi:hypothetical protein